MELDFAILARTVKTRKGMSHCEFLGWKSYTLLAFPQCLDAALLFRVDFADDAWETALPHNVEIYFLDEARNTIANPKGIEVQLPVGQTHFTHSVGLQDVMIQRAGDYTIEIYLDRKLAKKIRFKAKLATQGAKSPQSVQATS
jgi:hypothetical protein